MGKKWRIMKNNYKKINSINNKKYTNNYDKIHMKYNSMRMEDFYGLKGKKKALNEININKIGNTSNNKIINNELKHYITISNDNDDLPKSNDINEKIV